MAYLGNPKGTMEIIKKYHLSIQKKFGQNFLVDDDILNSTVEAAKIGTDDCVLEIGPGIGTLTQYLAEKAGKVVAVEIDRALIPILNDTLSGYDNVEIINDDIMKVSINDIAEQKNNGKPLNIVANLPYYITTPIIMKILESGAPVNSVTVMVQKEVADRMTKEPGSRDYGALSVAVQYYCSPELITIAEPSCFIPRPGVDSAVIRLTKYADKPVKVLDEQFFFNIVKAAFAQRRKTLVNGLANAQYLDIDKAQVASALTNEGLREDTRGEQLSVSEFGRIADFLFKL